MAQYFAAQEQQWYDRYIAAEGFIDRLENKVFEQASRNAFLEGALREIAKLNNKRDRFSDEIDAVIFAALGEESNV
jgi:hypothetical protein